MAGKEPLNKASGRSKFPLWFIIAFIIIAVVLGGWYLLQPRGSDLDFSLVDIDGKLFRLRDFRGKAVLLDFMATWCGPCKASMPGLLKLHEDLGGEVVIISISVDPAFDTVETLRNWMDSWGAQWIHARDLADPPVGQLFEVRSIPTYVLLDKRGDIRYRHVGSRSTATLKEELLLLLSE